MDGDNRKNFLQNYKSYVLCYWHLLDTHDLLLHSLGKLSDETKVDSMHVPETSGSGHKGKGSDKNPTKNLKIKCQHPLAHLQQVKQSKSCIRKNQSDADYLENSMNAVTKKKKRICKQRLMIATK